MEGQGTFNATDAPLTKAQLTEKMITDVVRLDGSKTLDIMMTMACSGLEQSVGRGEDKDNLSPGTFECVMKELKYLLGWEEHPTTGKQRKTFLRHTATDPTDIPMSLVDKYTGHLNTKNFNAEQALRNMHDREMTWQDLIDVIETSIQIKNDAIRHIDVRIEVLQGKIQETPMNLDDINEHTAEGWSVMREEIHKSLTLRKAQKRTYLKYAKRSLDNIGSCRKEMEKRHYTSQSIQACDPDANPDAGSDVNDDDDEVTGKEKLTTDVKENDKKRKRTSDYSGYDRNCIARYVMNLKNSKSNTE